MDEPFYAAYLFATGIEHPMRQEIIAAGQYDPAEVARICLAPPESPFRLKYQKHMTHHMIDSFDIEWTRQVANAFLIRSPARVLASYAEKRRSVTAADIGLARQREIFDQVAQQAGVAPPVVDATDIRADPERQLRALCAALRIGFEPAMLSWPPGSRPEDGVWGSHWYQAVWKSTGFAPPENEGRVSLPTELLRVEEAVVEDYEYLRRFRVDAGS
jgi:hypothetical protein